MGADFVCVDMSISFEMESKRFSNDFEELRVIGGGSFGDVFLVRKRIDGWRYAVKKARNPVRNHGDRRHKLKEVYALAASGDCRHIIRYYDAWFENDSLFIQMEFCEGVRDFASDSVTVFR